jgi:hypothetical protein
MTTAGIRVAHRLETSSTYIPLGRSRTGVRLMVIKALYSRTIRSTVWVRSTSNQTRYSEGS